MLLVSEQPFLVGVGLEAVHQLVSAMITLSAGVELI